MTTEGDIYEVPLPPEKTVRRWLSHVWEHPLVDEETRQHRQEAKQILTEFMESQGISRDLYFAIPIGSFVWITVPESDYDFVLICKDKETLDERIKFTIVDTHPRKINFYSSFDTVDEILTNVSPQFTFPKLCALFLTPDDFICGNVELARATRLQAVEQMLAMAPERREGRWRSVQFFFEEKMKNWPNTEEKRSSRFKTRLGTRSLESRSPERWKEKFLESWQKIQIPNLDDYIKAIKQAEGALTLRE